MIINQTDRCIFAHISNDRSVVKLVMTREFDSRIAGSIPAAPLETGSKSMVDGWFWEPAARGSNPLSPIFGQNVYGLIAQLAERGIENPCVCGSNPHRAIFGGVKRNRYRPGLENRSPVMSWRGGS